MVSTRGERRSMDCDSNNVFAFDANFGEIHKRKHHMFKVSALCKSYKEPLGTTSSTQWLLNGLTNDEDVRDEQQQEPQRLPKREDFHPPLLMKSVAVKFLQSTKTRTPSLRRKREPRNRLSSTENGSVGKVSNRSCMRPLNFLGGSKTIRGDEIMCEMNNSHSSQDYSCFAASNKLKDYGQLSECSSSPRRASTTQLGDEISEELSGYDPSDTYGRPPDPPDIQNVVTEGLNLVDFEKKAHERACQLVSGWLHDVGIIDELMFQGGTGGAWVVESQIANQGRARILTTALSKSAPVVNTGKVTLAGFDTTQQSDAHSVMSSEGIEVGAHGFPIEGASRFNQEVMKLRVHMKNQLANVQHRLSRGNVAVSGRDVQEVVTAVSAACADANDTMSGNSTGDDGGIGQLRRLSAVIATNKKTNVGQKSASNVVNVPLTAKEILTRYPRLGQLFSASRNIQRCMREIDYFHQIPVTCDRLRDELWSTRTNEGEFAERSKTPKAVEHTQDWHVVQLVAREHVQLEFFLVDIALRLKRRMDKQVEDRRLRRDLDQRHGRRRGQRYGLRLPDDDTDIVSPVQRKGSHKLSIGISQKKLSLPNQPCDSMQGNYSAVNFFLQDYRRNVRDLGNDIRKSILDGLSMAWDLATSNRASSLLHLVEAVEVYEAAKGYYPAFNAHSERVENQEKQFQPTFRFEDLRMAAVKRLSCNFELRVSELFRRCIYLETKQAKETEECSSEDKVFGGVLRASNQLTSEMMFVHRQVAHILPPSWALHILWTTIVARMCSERIMGQIGGTDGHKLAGLTVTQLLDLMAWVESFRDHVQTSFPNIGKHNSSKSYLDNPPESFFEISNRLEVNVDAAMASLALANCMLWEVHDLSKDEFLLRTKEQTNEWLEHVYSAELAHDRTAEGLLITSLCEDVFALAGVQLRTIRGRLTRRSEALVQAVGLILKNLYEKQIKCRDRFLVDLESCCAAANDFLRMGERCEELMQELISECDLDSSSTRVLEELTVSLVALYGNDAIFAVQKIHLFIFEPIDQAISDELFNSEWLDICTHNELALTVVRTLEDFMADLVLYLDRFMVGKVLEALIIACVNFYIKCLLRKSSSRLDGSKKSIWNNDQKALMRMRGDFRVMKEYFESVDGSTYPSLLRIVENEFAVLDVIHELLLIACKHCDSNTSDFVFLLQKRIRNVPITKLVVGDLWHLVRPSEEAEINALLDEMEQQLMIFCPTDETAFESVEDRKTVPGLRLDQAVAMICDEGQRQRPLMKAARDQVEVTMKRWRKTWKKRLM